MAQRGIWRAHEQLVVVLKGINGSTGGYWHNFGNRVYTQLLTPEETGVRALPFLCAPMLLEEPSPSDMETGLELSWRPEVFGFVAEPSGEAEVSLGLESALKAQEDVYRAILLNPTLNGTVDLATFVPGGGTVAGVGCDYAEFSLKLELTTRFAAEDLGPDATA